MGKHGQILHVCLFYTAEDQCRKDIIELITRQGRCTGLPDQQ